LVHADQHFDAMMSDVLKKILALLGELRHMPAVEIVMWGGEAEHQVFASFIGRHPRFPLVQRKRWGVALLALPERFDGYFAGKARLALRRKRRRATELGYTFARINPLAELEPIHAINGSLDVRQGRPIDPDYLDPAALRAYFSRSTETFGIRDAEGRLVAYLDLRICGEVAVLSRLLGHGDALDQGVMYLLVSETLRELLDARSIGGPVRWVMYDMWFGAAPGLRYFKGRLGFAPYRVRWMWRAA
jgi:hypothetical protein